jgi:hypothetical protein
VKEQKTKTHDTRRKFIKEEDKGQDSEEEK